MSSSMRNGGSSHRNYKYRRLSSVEKGSGNCYISCDEDEDELFTPEATELKKIGGRSNNTGAKSSSSGTPIKVVSDYEHLVDRPIKSGETLTGIALKYRIPVSELKRVNKIIQEKEFFALKSLKIPVKANSFLAEMLKQEEQDACSENSAVAITRAAVLGTRSLSSCSEYESDSEMHVGYISIDRILRDTRTNKEAKRFLNCMQKDLANIREKTNSYKDSLVEVAAVLTDPRFRPLEQTEDKCTGADWGISWWKVLLAGTVLLVGAPLLYIYLYLENK
ncbi:lysM and putative peptidoglycan-binding domain-containing protein 3-like [Homarus americanus]|uniref:LysM and putative peptidoglycan-binding domain-containing protein 3-like n=1 Tax=Homarus americanus TaxID=6706 RepID=A0A8J5MR84_HOMAM|nr:lysM and putative peptidoglycan-binding domain-containing protein 3-like [Homarus americanus]KAG7160372.1 lysM and putative peptidoglycan-binding domain-containing protein 3-like [Homarus americanus]